MNATPDATLHLDHWRIMRSRVWLVIVVLLLTLGGAAIFTRLNPQNYIASATIDIQAGKTQQPVAQGSSTESTEDMNFEASQLEAAFSHEVLDPVIQQFDLRTKWSQNGESLSWLRRIVGVETVEKTKFAAPAEGLYLAKVFYR